MSSAALLTIGALVDEMAALLSSTHGGAETEEARELLALQFDKPRYWPFSARDLEVTAEEHARGIRAARRRASGAPLQYAAGRAVFRHLTLSVDERVLIPRAETEMLVDIVLDRTRDVRGGIAVDVGTGSGAIALSLAHEGRFDRVIGTDVSLDALVVAAANAAAAAGRSCAAVEMRHGSLLGPVTERGLRAVVSNPPYISFDEASSLPPSVRNWEPPIALFSSNNGMAATVHLVGEAAMALAPNGLLALEVDTRRAILAAGAVAAHGWYQDVQVLNDLTGRERFVVARRREERE